MIGGAMDFLAGGWFPAITGVLGLLENQNLQRELREQIIPPQRALNEQLNQQAATLGRNVVQGYEGLRDRSMGYLDNIGRQERVDINRDMTSRLNSTLARNPGMSTSNIYGAGAAFARSRQDALRGLEGRLSQQRLATDASLTGQMLQAQSDTGYRNIQLQAGLQDTLNQLIMGNQPRSFLMDLSNMASAMRPAPQPDSPSFGDTLEQGFAGSISTLPANVATLGAAGYFSEAFKK